MVLFVKYTYFPHSLPNLLGCPKSLLLRTEYIISCHKDIDWSFFDSLYRHIGSDAVSIVLQVLWSILLKALLHPVLKHVFKCLYRCGLEVIVVCHAVLHADLVAYKSARFPLPARI